MENVELHIPSTISPLSNTVKDPRRACVEDNVLCYIASYIAHKVKEKVCSYCQESLTGDSLRSKDDFFLKTKNYSDTTVLTIPSSKLFTVAKKLDNIYNGHVEQLLHTTGIKKKLLVQFNKGLINETLDCSNPTKPCKIQETVQVLFLNVRLHFTLKDNTRSFSIPSKRRNRKLLKICLQ